MVLTVKQIGSKYRVLLFWYDSTKDWTAFLRAQSEFSTHEANGFFLLSTK